MSPLVILFQFIAHVISSDLKRSCSDIIEPYEDSLLYFNTSLPLQCSTITSNGTQNYDPLLEAYVLRCDPDGNYPYLLNCNFKPDFGYIRNETCVAYEEPLDSITCCNQVIKDWDYTIQRDISQSTQKCPDNYQLTGCDNLLTYSISTTNCTAYEAEDSNYISYAQCHQLPSDQKLICNTINTISGSTRFEKTEACPDNGVMLWCDNGIILYNETGTGLCTGDYDIAYCCSLYQIEPYDTKPKYLLMDNYNLYNYSQTDDACLQAYGTHAASIHTQADFIEAYDLCLTNASVSLCCLGGDDEKRKNVWVWDDGSGTFPSNLKWNQGGLWRDGQPESKHLEHYACIYTNDATAEGIRDCQITYLNTDRCHPICNAPETASRRRLFTETYTRKGNGFCFELDILMNVENILPDPQYISREANIDVIQTALAQTLNEHQITGFNITSIDDIDALYSSVDITVGIERRRRRMAHISHSNWSSINDECPYPDDTIHRFYFQTIPYNITCNETTFRLNNTSNSGRLQCEFTTPQSAVYVWSVDTVSAQLLHSNCSGVEMLANITETDGYRMGHSELIEVHEDMGDIKTFIFNGSALLQQDRTYVLIINIWVRHECDNRNGFVFLYNNTLPQVLIQTVAEPSSCELSSKLASDTAMIFGAAALCNANTSNATRELLEDVLYQSHSSDTFITSQEWAALPDTTRRRMAKGSGTPTPTKDDCGTQTCKNSLDIMFQDGTLKEIAPDEIFPCYGQCIAYDGDTNRVYAVGGQQDGAAVDWLKVFELESQQSAVPVNDSNAKQLKLDKPRVAAMCYHYVNKYDNNKEYIIVINGFNNSDDIIGNSDVWYSDIVFIPLDAEETTDHLPQIKLKYNVIDMRPFVSESNELYLFGGRDGTNATDFVQVLDLNDVFNGSFTSSDVLSTMDRMQPMQTPRVLPFVDFLTIRFPNGSNESCIMILGGQDYVNNEWIDIELPVTGLQLYCNNVLKIHLENQRRRMQYTNYTFSKFVEFTDFDTSNLINFNESEQNMSMMTKQIVIVQYNFENDGILYEFNETFQLCFDGNRQLLNAIDLMESDNSGLTQNILQESKRNYRGWSYGFGEVNISNMNIFIYNNTETVISTTETITTTEEVTPSPSVIMTTYAYLPTMPPTEEKLNLVVVILIVAGAVVGVVILGIAIYFIYRCSKNRNPYLRAPELDIDDETEDENL